MVLPVPLHAPDQPEAFGVESKPVVPSTQEVEAIGSENVKAIEFVLGIATEESVGEVDRITGLAWSTKA